MEDKHVKHNHKYTPETLREALYKVGDEMKKDEKCPMDTLEALLDGTASPQQQRFGAANVYMVLMIAMNSVTIPVSALASLVGPDLAKMRGSETKH